MSSTQRRSIVLATVAIVLLGCGQAVPVVSFDPPRPAAEQRCRATRYEKNEAHPCRNRNFGKAIQDGCNLEFDITLPRFLSAKGGAADSSRRENRSDRNNAGSAIFLLFAVTLSDMLRQTIKKETIPRTAGAYIFLLVTATLAYDNLIIGIGSFFFPQVKADQTQYRILKILSYPRFIFHAVGTPLMAVTTSEVGAAAGVPWLQEGQIWPRLAWLISATTALVSRVSFARSPGITLANSDGSQGALDRGLVRFTYTNPSFLYIVPAIVLTFWNIVVGVAAVRGSHSGEDSHVAGLWLVASAVSIFIGNAHPPHVSRFLGNFGEIVLQYGYLKAAKAVKLY